MFFVSALYDTDVWADLMLLITSYFLRIAKNQKSVSKNTILEINFMVTNIFQLQSCLCVLMLWEFPKFVQYNILYVIDDGSIRCLCFYKSFPNGKSNCCCCNLNFTEGLSFAFSVSNFVDFDYFDQDSTLWVLYVKLFL